MVRNTFVTKIVTNRQLYKFHLKYHGSKQTAIVGLCKALNGPYPSLSDSELKTLTIKYGHVVEKCKKKLMCNNKSSGEY